MAPERTRRRIPDATVARLPVYLRILTEQDELGIDSISSEQLAELGGVNAAKVRKDLSYLGSYGTRGVGYEVAYLVYQIRRELGLTHDWPVVIVGAGNLGQALAGYGGFGQRGFPVAGTNCHRSCRPSGSASAWSRPPLRQRRTLPTGWCAPASPAS
jgi:redox-sensing transcriptional repressor